MRILTKQRTVKRIVGISGTGVHSDKKVNLLIKPAPPNHGIRFVRTDLPDQPSVIAHFNTVVDTSLATVIGQGDFIVSTIEHLMATFAGFSIDNAIVELDSYEMPILDGSAAPYTSILRSGGVEEQDYPRCYFIVKKPIKLVEDDKSVCIYPSDIYKMTYTIDFKHPIINKQTFDIEITPENFESEIAAARTFGFLHEIEYLQKYGFARGGSLDNVIAIDKDKILNEDGLRFEDEFVRHKILDSIGDFSLIGMPIIGHVIINKSGHFFNHLFIKKFFNEKKSWETCTF